jgi:choline dehydrogenase
LEGSSAINFMMLAHGSAVDIDNWEKLGNPGWSYKNLLPYYRESETFNAPDEATSKALGGDVIDPSLHGTSGPVQITFPHSTSQLDAAWKPTFETLGLDAKQDPRK